MPRGILDLGKPDDLEQVHGVWKFAPGLVPGEPNEGLLAQSQGALLASPITMILAGNNVMT